MAQVDAVRHAGSKWLLNTPLLAMTTKRSIPVNFRTRRPGFNRVERCTARLRLKQAGFR